MSKYRWGCKIAAVTAGLLLAAPVAQAAVHTVAPGKPFGVSAGNITPP